MSQLGLAGVDASSESLSTVLRGGKTGSLGWDGLTYGGCSCHNTKADHRKAKKSIKQREKRAWKKEQH